MKSLLGYKDNSPYRYDPYNIINTPKGLITMDGVSTPLLAMSERGELKFLPPNSGLHKFKGKRILEIPVMQGGGNVIQPKPRKGVRKNPDGTESTHLMTYTSADGKWYAYPTLFQKEDGTWYELSDKNDWEVFKEAQRLNEIYEFGTEEEAKQFSEGSWKNKFQTGGNADFNKWLQQYGVTPVSTRVPSDNTTQVIRTPSGPKVLATPSTPVLTPEQYKENIRRKKEADAKEIQRRKDNIARSNSSKGFMEGARNSALGDKMRFFPNDPNSFIDEWINPLKWVGDMADNLGHTIGNPNSTVGDYAFAVGTPVAGGLVGKFGAKNTSQWANNLVNPLVGTGDLINNLGNKYLPNAYKLNPYAFKPNSNSYYRMLGDEGLEDLKNVGYIRSNPNTFYKDKHPFFSKGYPIDGRIGKSVVKGSKYEGEHMAEVIGNREIGNRFEKNRWADAAPDPNIFVARDKITLNNPNLKVYEKDWLKGYKEIPKPTSNFKSEIDWEKWVKYKEDFHNNPEVIKHLNEIEKTAKINGTWMKNPDGTPFKGTKEQFVVQQSDNFKKAFGKGSNISYRGDLSNLSEIKSQQELGKEALKRKYNLTDEDTEALEKLWERSKDKLNSGRYTTNDYDAALKHAKGDKNKVLSLYTDIRNPKFTETGESFRVLEKDRQKLLSEGYDALITKPSSFYPEGENVLLRNNQIKSAVGNILFDMTNPNIYKGIIPPALLFYLQSQNQNKSGDIYKFGGKYLPLKEYRNGGYKRQFQNGVNNFTDEDIEQRRNRVVEEADRVVATKDWWDLPEDFVKENPTAEGMTCIGGVCYVLNKAGVLPRLVPDMYKNTEFERLASSYGLSKPLYGLQNLKKGDILQHRAEANDQGRYYPTHGQIFTGRIIDGKYEFFDNFNKEYKRYTKESLEELLSPSIGEKRDRPSAQIISLDPRPRPNGLTAEQKREIGNDMAVSRSTGSYTVNNPNINDMQKTLLGLMNDNSFDADLQRVLRVSAQDLERMKPLVYGMFGQESNFGNPNSFEASTKYNIENIPYLNIAASTGKTFLHNLANPFNNRRDYITGQDELSLGPAQIKYKYIPQDVKDFFGINSPEDLKDPRKAYIAALSSLQEARNIVNNYVDKGTRPELADIDEYERALYWINSPGKISNPQVNKDEYRNYLDAQQGYDHILDIKNGEYVQRENPFTNKEFSSEWAKENLLQLDKGSYPWKVLHAARDLNQNLHLDEVKTLPNVTVKATRKPFTNSVPLNNNSLRSYLNVMDSPLSYRYDQPSDQPFSIYTNTPQDNLGYYQKGGTTPCFKCGGLKKYQQAGTARTRIEDLTKQWPSISSLATDQPQQLILNGPNPNSYLWTNFSLDGEQPVPQHPDNEAWKRDNVIKKDVPYNEDLKIATDDKFSLRPIDAIIGANLGLRGWSSNMEHNRQKESIFNNYQDDNFNPTFSRAFNDYGQNGLGLAKKGGYLKVKNRFQFGGDFDPYEFLFGDDDDDEKEEVRITEDDIKQKSSELAERELELQRQQEELEEAQNYALAMQGVDYGTGSKNRRKIVMDNEEILKLTDIASKTYGVPKDLLLSQQFAESGGNPNAVSSKGAFGLTQFMPKTAEAYGVKKGDVASQINGQAAYMRDLYDQFGNWDLAIMAYNAGPGNVKSGKAFKFKETKDYLQKVKNTNVIYEQGGQYDLSVNEINDLIARGYKIKTL